MNTLEKLEEAYSAYLRDMELSRQSSNNMRSLLSDWIMGNHRHDVVDLRFIADTDAAMSDYDAASEDGQAIIRFILDKSVEYMNDNTVGVMFSAMHRYLPPLAAAQPPDYRRQLAAWYDETFPRRLRTPVMVDFRKSLD